MTSLTEAEQEAVLWAAQAAASVVSRAQEEGRLMPAAPAATVFRRGLEEGTLLEEDRQHLLAALRFACSLYAPAMLDIRQVLQPPELATLQSAERKLSQSSNPSAHPA